MEDTLTQGKFKLLDAFLNNEEVPIREFYIAEYPKTKYYILKNGGTVDNAKDVFQEAYFVCWKKLSSRKFQPKNKNEIEAYLFTIARNKWIDQTRAATKRKTTSINDKMYQLAADDNPTGELEKKDKQLTITLAAFENLGQGCKDLLTQFYFNKMSLRTIAEKLNIEEASAKNKKYRCIQKLKELALGKN
ncbi:sigma-70 family RNA polymerase sigma factor [Aequorivita sp. F47161]|uniref:Sigma-70 family RNA polymerase sigma factor n=1 Tax=Aequorivita vitellina TaxID=2874475 RepID=A0A9X1QUV2_9FLAO|nr:sigma-70 family RNA polymerase sigma factor [Aequorivita vitellina]MCG2419936.1 sigma-70 family RNA polymerase sigma factor [Aequorivita vitellina]